jgi:ubiquitin-conjugating enzyme E2 variant
MISPSDKDVAVPADALPRHDDFSLARRCTEAACIATAAVLLLVHWLRLLANPAGISWWLLPFVVAGIAAADFVSGLIHWAADTWGSETMPIVGRRILRPFRVHHINPADFLRRQFLDTNGDVAAIVILFLVGMFWIPGSSVGRTASAFLLGFCTVGLFTNQIHQWAHMRVPPRLVRFMQRCGLILSGDHHERHHRSPHVTDYCIATGWCNGLLNRLAFFRRLEQFVTLLTGLVPREDEIRFHVARTRAQGLPHYGEITSD